MKRGEWDYEAANGAEAVAANPNAIVFAIAVDAAGHLEAEWHHDHCEWHNL